MSDGGLPEINVVTLNNNQILLNNFSGTGTTTSFTTKALSQTTTGPTPTTITATWEDIINNTSIRPKYASTYNDASKILLSTSSYSQTFDINTTPFTATLPEVDGTNVGIQFLITNTNATALDVNSQSSQLIYSSTGSASATTKPLNKGHSHIFTAIRTTASNVYGWSMV